jgi:hypothetical protein
MQVAIAFIWRYIGQYYIQETLVNYPH